MTKVPAHPRGTGVSLLRRISVWVNPSPLQAQLPEVNSGLKSPSTSSWEPQTETQGSGLGMSATAEPGFCSGGIYLYKRVLSLPAKLWGEKKNLGTFEIFGLMIFLM